MSKKDIVYDNESIRSMEDIDIIRKRPGMLLGSNTLDGYKHTFFEILSNSIDEAKVGYGDTIDIYFYKDYSMKIVDRGRGLPVDWNSNEKVDNWVLLFTKLYAGAKFDENAYEKNLGLHGVGVCATQSTSEWTKAEIYRDGYKYNLEFEKGYNVGGLKKTKLKTDKTRTGTSIHWKGDLDIFTDIDIESAYLKDITKTQAIINPGIKFNFYEETDEGMNHIVYFYEKGIFEYVKEIANDDLITEPYQIEGEGRGRDKANMKDYDTSFNLVFAFSDTVSRTQTYHNSSPLEGGSPLRAIQSAFAYVFNDQIKQMGIGKKNDPRITYSDIEDNLVVVSNSFSTADLTNYEHQTKKAINNKFVRDFMNDEIRKGLTIWFIENKKIGKKILTHVLERKRNKNKRQEQNKILKKNIIKKIDNIDNKVEKFVDCESDDASIRELFIVEGDSAAGSVKLAREAEFQGVMPVRGKILNCLKASKTAMLKNQVIIDLINVLGCGIEGKNFDIDGLRWNKVIICTDADYDGYQIRTLIITMIYVLAPQLLEQGYVYIVETPLFEITHKSKGKTNTYFAFTEEELDEITKGKSASSLKIQRSKGLGQNNPDMMWETTMNPDNRRLIQIRMDEDEKDIEVCFDTLLGKNLNGRKKYIEGNLHQYIDEADI